MKYQAKIVLENKNNSHTLAFDQIQKISSGRKLIILEVGCSSGYFGNALMEQGHEVWGVEPDAIAAEEARKKLSFVHTGFIEDFFTRNENARFDVIVFGDVLEHLVDPVLVLQCCKKFFNLGGCIVASVPNVAHIAIRAMLLEGRWDYSDLGILDRTHLKFYTRSSLAALFADAGYALTSIDPVRISVEQVDEICNLNLTKKSIAAAVDFSKDTCGYDFQYVITAKPRMEGIDSETEHAALNGEGLRVVCMVHSTDSSIVDIRLRNPLNLWANCNGGGCRILSIFEHTISDLEWGDAFVFQRDCNDYAASIIRQLKLAGKKVVFELDDLLLNLPPFLPHHQVTINQNKKFIVEALKTADAVSVSTTELAKQITSLNKQLFVTPNYSESISRHAQQFTTTPDQIKLIVASSDQVLIDFILQPLKMIQDEFSVVVIGIGPPSKILIESGIKTRRFETMSHKEFKNLLASFDNAIGIIPLDDSLFSSCKSAVKYFDYSMAGIPSICSNVLPYKVHISNEKSGILVENETEDWYLAIKKLVLNAAMREDIARNARQSVEQNCNLATSANAWKTLIDSLNIDINKRYSSKINLPSNRGQFFKILKWSALHLFRHGSYAKAYSTIKRHGLVGLFRRVKRA